MQRHTPFWIRILPLLGALSFLNGCEPSTNAPSPAGSSPSNPAPSNLTVPKADGTPPENSSGEPRQLRIAVIPKGTTHEFWKSVHAGADRAAGEMGNVEILWKGPLQEDDRDGQINVIQDFVTQQVDGIVLAPLDSQALVNPVKEAKAAGIPTVIFDSGLADPSVVVSYVATDNYVAGTLAAKRLGEVLEGKGNAILLRYAPGSESTEQREQGFLDVLQKDFPKIKLISSNEYAGSTAELAFEKSQQLLVKYRDEVQGVFAVNESSGMGMYRALDQAGLLPKVKFVTFDPSERLIAGMAEGKVLGIVLQDPVTMGYRGVKTMVEHLRGAKVEPRISTGEYIATPENAQTEEMQRLLKPVTSK